MSGLATYRGLGAPGLLIENVSLASTLVTLTLDQQGKVLVFDNTTAASRIRLPAPEAGIVYNVLFSTGGVSSRTKITSSGVYDILVAGTTGKGVANESTAEKGVIIQLVGLSEFRWAASRLGASTLNINSTST